MESPTDLISANSVVLQKAGLLYLHYGAFVWRCYVLQIFFHLFTTAPQNIALGEFCDADGVAGYQGSWPPLDATLTQLQALAQGTV